MERSLYSVGNCYPEWRTNNILIQAAYPGDCLQIIYGVPQPTKEERASMMEDTLSIAFAVVEDFPFFLLSTTRLNWVDAPFYPNLYSADVLDKHFESGEGMPLIVFLVDTSTGKLVHLRMCGLSSSMSNEVFEVCRSLSSLPTLDMAGQSKKINDIYRRYPTSAALLAGSKPEWTTTFVR